MLVFGGASLLHPSPALCFAQPPLVSCSPVQPDQAVAHPAFARLLSRVQQRVPEMNEVQLATSIYALAQLRAALPPGPALQQWVLRAAVLGEELKARDMSMLVHSLGTMGAGGYSGVHGGGRRGGGRASQDGYGVLLSGVFT